MIKNYINLISLPCIENLLVRVYRQTDRITCRGASRSLKNEKCEKFPVIDSIRC